jgi:peptide-methionine (S)-S-oxide reductase
MRGRVRTHTSLIPGLDRFLSARLLLGLLMLTCSLLPRNADGQIGGSSATAPPQPKMNESIAVLAGGCFWGVDGVFKHVKGVTSVTSGYSGGTADTAQYETVSTGTTGHAESVEIIYDPSKISYSHNPTELNRQGPDHGTQYRSVIFYANDEQKRLAENYIKQLGQEKAFPDAIVTQVVPLKSFYPAEGYHQSFLERNPDNPYIVFNDMPKLAQLHEKFPAFYIPSALGK